jgi:hypothetical protein
MLNAVAVVPVIVGMPIVSVPVAAPTAIVVAAPNAFTVVALVLKTVAVPVAVVVISAPLTARSPVTTVLALLIVAVPVAAPILTVVPAPAKFTVVAVALTKLNVVAVVVMSPPLTAKSPVSVTSPVTPSVPPTNAFLAIATPPAVCIDAAVSLALEASDTLNMSAASVTTRPFLTTKSVVAIWFPFPPDDSRTPAVLLCIY